MKYRIFCETENKYINKEGLLISEICSNSTEHIVTSGSATILVNNDKLLPENGISKDYRKQRRDLISYVIANSQTMSMEELKLAAEHFCLPKENRDMFFSMDEQIKNGEEFNRRATQSRQIRFNILMSKLFNRYTYEQTTQIIKKVTGDDLIFNYINLGIEGTTEGDELGLFDYIESTSGTIYENTGLLHESFSPIDITTPELIIKLMHVMRDGCLDITCSGNCGF